MARGTTTRQAPRNQQRQQPQAPQPEAPDSKGEVARFEPTRLAYHPAIASRFGIDASAWKVLVESTWPSAKTPDSVVLALSYCKARNLDPFKRPVHIVPITIKKMINGQEKFVEVETVWPAISETRTTAFRTKDYAGMDQPEFGPTRTFKLIDQAKEGSGYIDIPMEIDAPEWCQITVHRMVDGVARPFPGPRCYFTEFYAPKNRFCTAPNEQWRRKPSYMLEKCAEATSLRRAFPEEYGDKYAIEELGSLGHLKTVGGDATFGAGRSGDDDPGERRRPTPTSEPKRGDFTGGRAAAAGAQEEPPPPETDNRGEGGTQGNAPTQDDERGAGGRGGPNAESESRGTSGGTQEGTGERHGSAPQWRVPEDVVGQDNVIRWIENAIEKAPDAETVDAVELDNADKIAKLGDLKRSALNKRADDKRASLGVDR